MRCPYGAQPASLRANVKPSLFAGADAYDNPREPAKSLVSSQLGMSSPSETHHPHSPQSTFDVPKHTQSEIVSALRVDQVPHPTSYLVNTVHRPGSFAETDTKYLAIATRSRKQKRKLRKAFDPSYESYLDIELAMQAGRRGRPNRQPKEGGRGRGGSNQAHNPLRPPRPRPDYQSVPPFAAIKVGSGVAVVLKEDQPTGHQVKGIVADLLTRGDHPRGVKVRLRDGRVGRVQGLVSEVDGERGEALVGGADVGLGRNGEGAGGRANGGGKSGRIEKDIRDDDEYLYAEDRMPVANQGYFAALEAADKRHEERRGGSEAAGAKPQSMNEVATCPVCGIFEGDEVAVAHHVEGHFAE